MHLIVFSIIQQLAQHTERVLKHKGWNTKYQHTIHTHTAFWTSNADSTNILNMQVNLPYPKSKSNLEHEE